MAIPVKPSVAKNSIVMLSAQVVIKLLGFFFTLYAARVLGVEIFGQYGFAVALITFFSVISSAGLDTYQTRQTAFMIGNQSIDSLMTNSFLARLMVSIMSVLIIYLISIFINKPLSFKVFLMLSSLAMAVNFLMGNFSSALLGHERFKLYGVLAMGSQTLGTILGLLALYIGLGLIGIGIAHFTSAVVATIVIGLIVSRRVCRFRFGGSLAGAAEILKKAAPLAVAAILTTIYYKADFVMLSFIKGDTAVGYYNSAYALVNGLLLVSTSFSATILPRMSGYFRSDEAKLNQLYSNSFKYMLFIGLAAAFGATFLAKPLFILVYPESYMPGVDALKILIWALALMFVNMIQSAHLIARDLSKQLMIITGIGAIINIILNFILIPRFSFSGAAVATVVSEVLAGIGFFLLLRRHLPLSQLLSWLGRLIPAIAAMSLFLIFTPALNVILRIIGGAVIFAVILTLSKGLTRQDLDYLINLLPWGKN
ncbi:MAG: flippase [candidate division Zixibacteria bacterium]|nr:flippase [candidate division Zixibacteria bacterium]